MLAPSTVTNTNPSGLGQSVGLSPGTSIVGFPPGIVLAPGTIEASSPVTLQAQNDLTTGYANAAGRSVEFTQTNPDLVGQTLIPGVYAATAKAPLSLSGQLVLDSQNTDITLPRTGNNVGSTTGFGAGGVIVGFVALRIARRRRRPDMVSG